ncbi:MAG: hypothetical protein ACP5OY_07170 [Halothiobacillaceae bacterium]
MSEKVGSVLHFVLSPYLFSTPRRRLAAAALLLSLFAVSLWGVRAWRAAAAKREAREWFSAEVLSDNIPHPLHLVFPAGREGISDLILVQNLSDEPLSLLPFSSRPRAPGLSGPQILAAWAQWIATSRQGLIIQPHSSWVLDPQHLDGLPAFHGHTWIAQFFAAPPLRAGGALPATTLPAGYRGRFRLWWCASSLPEDEIGAPQLYRQALVGLLQREADSTGRRIRELPAVDLRGLNGLTAADLR